jgi:hypothetical protein
MLCSHIGAIVPVKPVQLKISPGGLSILSYKKSTILPVIRAQLHDASVQQLWRVTLARYRLFGKVRSLIWSYEIGMR